MLQRVVVTNFLNTMKSLTKLITSLIIFLLAITTVFYLYAKSSNADDHGIKILGVIKNLKKISNDEESLGNTSASDEIDRVIKEERNEIVDITEAIDEVENRPAWKTFLLGADYKNLGHLRSYLSHNENQIRKLVRTSEKLGGSSDKSMYAEQISTLAQERERIRALIAEHQDDFGLLGWVVRFLTGYTKLETE